MGFVRRLIILAFACVASSAVAHTSAHVNADGFDSPPRGSLGAAQVARTTELRLRAAATVSPLPEYPGASLKKNVGGVAVAAVRIGVDGRVEEVVILEAPDEHIAEAVRMAVTRWVVPSRMGPAGETARPRTGKLTFYFQIANGGGRVRNPADMPGGSASPASGGSAAAAPGRTPAPSQRQGATSPRSAKTIALAELQKGTDERPTILDIGERDAFRRGHLPGAINIPVDELPVRGGIELARSKAIAVDCTRDEMWRCQAAASMLARQGFPNVSVVVR